MLCVQVLLLGYYHWSSCTKQHAGYNPAAFDMLPPRSLHLGKLSCLLPTQNLVAVAFHGSLDSGVLRVSQTLGQLLIVTRGPKLEETKITQREEISTKSFKETHTFLSLVTCCYKAEDWNVKACWVQWCYFNVNMLLMLFCCCPFFFLRSKFSHTL